MALFKKKSKKSAAAAPAVEPKSFVIIKNAPEPKAKARKIKVKGV